MLWCNAGFAHFHRAEITRRCVPGATDRSSV